MPSSHTAAAPSASRRVPVDNGGILVDPGLLTASQWAQDTHDTDSWASIRLGGQSLADWRRSAVADTLAAAGEYAEEAGLVVPAFSQTGPLVVGGHQPTLFHCGVLIKNFAMARLARHTGGSALNLIVDNDIAAPLHLSVPDGTRDEPATRLVPFTTNSASRPFEDIPADLSGAFTGFPRRITDALDRWNIAPILTSIWPAAVSAAEQGRGLADCLSAARISLQSHLDHSTLELPISRLSTREPFLRFLGVLLADAERFAESHNGALAAYRVANRVRSRTHPAADLAQADGWTETPFWTWQAGDTHRQRLLVRSSVDKLFVSDGRTFEAVLDGGRQSDSDALVSQLGSLQREGRRIRPSALSTTLFARLCLADLFVHGIGGSKYDEVTDALMADYLGLAPPGYLTLSGTLHLPLGGPFDATAAERQGLLARKRRMLYNAHEFLDASEPHELRDRKQRLIAAQHADRADFSMASRARRRLRYRDFRAVDEALARHTIGARQALDGDLQRLDRQLNANTVLTNREFSFCLFPESVLTGYLEHALSELP